MSAKLETAIEAARQECLEHGRATGHEMAVMLDAEGTYLLSKKGGKAAVEFDIFEMFGMRLSHTAVLVHNHPGEFAYSLSAPDIMMANWLECEVIAVTEDGGIYRSKGIAATQEEEFDRMNEITNKLYEPDQELAMPHVTLSHEINLALHEAGYLKSYDYILGTSHAALHTGASECLPKPSCTA